MADTKYPQHIIDMLLRNELTPELADGIMRASGIAKEQTAPQTIYEYAIAQNFNHDQALRLQNAYYSPFTNQQLSEAIDPATGELEPYAQAALVLRQTNGKVGDVGDKKEIQLATNTDLEWWKKPNPEAQKEARVKATYAIDKELIEDLIMDKQKGIKTPFPSLQEMASQINLSEDIADTTKFIGKMEVDSDTLEVSKKGADTTGYEGFSQGALENLSTTNLSEPIDPETNQITQTTQPASQSLQKYKPSIRRGSFVSTGKPMKSRYGESEWDDEIRQYIAEVDPTRQSTEQLDPQIARALRGGYTSDQVRSNLASFAQSYYNNPIIQAKQAKIARGNKTQAEIDADNEGLYQPA